ncbi:Metallo-dependent phosphatase-like protein [Mycena albidolilacea]|uniref:Metallo-dependent phosphatase-like protein n=1 Tax=Mycena albidolilacea TaxID=1033008 RepID=A0AAD7EQ29_9AGAR|nr:Metallo-dependent phosphatase-like protein [Mycena albidolilacea]
MPVLGRKRPVLDGLKLLWTVLAIWYEHVAFIYSVEQCSWPDSEIQTRTDSLPRPTHVLLVADPQILDHRSYPDRAPFLTYISQLLVDLNLRKNWRAALRMQPDIVMFLGDMMDGGRFAMSDAEYERYFQRFKSIFPLDSHVPQYFISGNHDTGLGISDEFSEKAETRYTSHFGPLNSRGTIANNTIIFLNAPGLVDEDSQHHRSNYDGKSVPGGPVELVQSYAKSPAQDPVILFTHIPLSRPDRADCGPNRERGTIRRGTGFGYQNTLGKPVTDFLLQTLRPSVIFSGDDHDYCEYTHSYNSDGKTREAREVTVKSLSMAMGIRRPGFQLLSLVQPQGSSSHADSLCLLPDQLGIYLSTYIPLLVLSLLVLCVANIYRVFSPRQSKRRSGSVSPNYVPLSGALRSRSDAGNPTEPNNDWLDYPDADILPQPTSSSRQVPRPIYSQTFVLLGRRRRITVSRESIASLVSTMFSCCGNHDVPKSRGCGVGFLRDVRDVAVFPLGIFAAVSWWMFVF